MSLSLSQIEIRILRLTCICMFAYSVSGMWQSVQQRIGAHEAQADAQ